MRALVVATAIAMSVPFLPVPTAAATTFTVSAGDNFWSPTPLTIAVGDSVHFVKTGANPHSLSSSFKSCPDPLSSCTHAFTTPGTYSYICGVHGAAMSGSITVSGPPPPPPAITISSPTEGATVSGTITVSGTATPPTGKTITKVEVKVDLTGTYALATGTTSWSRSVDLSSLTNGAHRIYAKATASNGGVKETWRNVTVNNPLTRDLQPTQILSSPVSTTSTQDFVTVTVKNNGNQATVPYHIKLEFAYKGGRQFAGEVFAGTMPAFGEQSFTMIVGDLFHYGRFNVVAIADDLAQVVETNENNNEFTGAVTLVTSAIAGQDIRDPHT